MIKHLNTFAILFALMLMSASGSADENLSRKPQLGDVARDFTLKSSTGENIRLNELRGEIVIINFWASWSGTSRRFVEQFEELYQAQRDNGVSVLSINIDPEKSQTLISRLDASHTLLLDTDRIASRLYRISIIPSIYIVNRDGELLLILEGYDPLFYQITANKLQRTLEQEQSQ